MILMLALGRGNLEMMDGEKLQGCMGLALKMKLENSSLNLCTVNNLTIINTWFKKKGSTHI